MGEHLFARLLECVLLENFGNVFRHGCRIIVSYFIVRLGIRYQSRASIDLTRSLPHVKNVDGQEYPPNYANKQDQNDGAITLFSSPTT